MARPTNKTIFEDGKLKNVFVGLSPQQLQDLDTVSEKTHTYNRSSLIRRILLKHLDYQKASHPEWFSNLSQPQREAVYPCSTTPLETPSD